MTTSGSTDFELDVSDYIEEAFERCGLEVRNGYDLQTAKRSLNLMLGDWANRGLNQWTIDQTTIALTEGTSEYTLGASTIDVLDAVIRRSGTDLRWRGLVGVITSIYPLKALNHALLSSLLTDR